MFSSFSPRETKTCRVYKTTLIAAGLQDRFLFQENDQVMKMCSLDLWLGSIYSGWTESAADCFGCSSVIRDEKPPAEGCVIVNASVSLMFRTMCSSVARRHNFEFKSGWRNRSEHFHIWKSFRTRWIILNKSHKLGENYPNRCDVDSEISLLRTPPQTLWTTVIIKMTAIKCWN